MPETFDAATLDLLHATKEVRIRAGARPVVIWIVVANGAVFVRSVRGPTGRWFIAAKANGRAALLVGDKEFAVRVAPVTDGGTIDLVSQAFLSKYATSSYAKAMVAPEVLPTTLRLDPVDRGLL